MKKTENKGITLIALVITIIVMLILVGVTINLSLNGGLFGYAKQAVKETEKVRDQELQLADGLINGQTIDEIVNGNSTSGGNSSTEGSTSGEGSSTGGSSSGGTTESTISETDSYIGYYADMNADGTVDGIIFADLAFSKRGTWGDSAGTYSYTAESNLKEYYIKEEDYTDDFGTKDVIAPVTGTKGNDRFYIMALDDFTTISYSTFFWYYNAGGNMSDYSTATSGDFGKGKSNTIEMISKWNNSSYGTQNTERDMWGVIQNSNIVTSVSDSGKWFIASRAEWSAFADNLEITSSNCGGDGLSFQYWSSSQLNNYNVRFANFGNNCIASFIVSQDSRVRYAATF